MDICVLRSGMELATAEVKGDIAKARKEMTKKNKVQPIEYWGLYYSILWNIMVDYSIL